MVFKIGSYSPELVSSDPFKETRTNTTSFMPSHQTPEKLFKCSTCDEVFDVNYKLDKHRRKVHQNKIVVDKNMTSKHSIRHIKNCASS
jgi:uncharacterized C2H2 Zn-finger protein